MPITIVDRYQLECGSCEYVWDTRYAKIPAKCPSCSRKIYGSNNYNTVTRYVHYEKTAEEKALTKFRIILGIILFIMFFVLIVAAGFWLSLAIVVVSYQLIMRYITKQIKKGKIKSA